MKKFKDFQSDLLPFLLLGIIAIVKIYLIFIYPREIYYFSTGLSKFNYYNTLSFSFDMQSFRDANHPGTPIYMIGYLILLFVGNQIKNFYQYFYAHHLFILFFNFFSIIIFINFFKKKLSITELISFLLIFISSFNFLFGLEIVSLISYQFGITLLLITYFIKSLNKQKNTKLAFISAFSISMKMTFLPFVLSIIIVKIYQELLKKKSLKNIFKFLSLFSIGFFVFNFPIIGRFPKIFLDIFFLRSDTSLSMNNFLYSSKLSLTELQSNSIFIVLIVIIFVIIFFINNYKFLFEKRIDTTLNTEYSSIIFFNFLITFFYFYTFVIAGQVYEADVQINILEKENFFRNNHPYLAFIFTNIYIIKKYYKLNILKYKKSLLILSFALFIFTLNNYLIERKVIITDKNEREKILIHEVSKYLNLNNDIIAYYTYSHGYGLGEEIFHLSGNSLEGNEKFTEEILDIHNNFRYFRFNDIIESLTKNKVSSSKISIFKNKIKKFDIFLKEKFPNNIYEMLSYQTKNSSLNPNIIRNKDVYSLQNSQKYKKANAILFSHPKINSENFVYEKDLYYYLKTRINIKEKVVFNVKNDKWFLYLIR